MRDERRLEHSTHPAATSKDGRRVCMCADVTVLNKASARAFPWPSQAGPDWSSASIGTCMPFGLENAGAAFQRLARLALVPRKDPSPREPPRLREPAGS